MTPRDRAKALLVELYGRRPGDPVAENVIAAGIATAVRAAYEAAANVAGPIHSPPDGCKTLCRTCANRRLIRDAIRALAGKEGA